MPGLAKRARAFFFAILLSMKSYAVRADIPDAVDTALLSLAPIVRKLLFYRGIKTLEDAQSFLHPVFEDNNDPFLIYGMDRAVKRVHDAVKKGEKIVIYSDYDADGIPGAVILHDFFAKIGYANFENYIPHRVLEGFGLNVPAIDAFAADGVKLVITIDCGTANIKEAERLKQHGIDLIVIDHHLPTMIGTTETLPEAVAVLNHKQRSCSYPDKNLCASAMSFKFVQGFLQKHGKEFGVTLGWEKWLLDMVALATVSDMVPLVGENRILAQYGLKVLRKSPRPGLQTLLSVIKVNQKTITEDDIGFMVSPRINAASRMGKPKDAFAMLIERDEAKAGAYARHLNEINDERKGIVAAMVKEIKKHWKEIDPEKKRKVLVAGNPEWRPSLLGLVANSLMDEHDGPVFLWGRAEGTTLKGSCRTDGSAGVVDMMREAADCFEEYGGHAASGGFAVKFEKVGELADALEAAHAKLKKAAGSREEEIADAKLVLDDIDHTLFAHIDACAPFGMANPKPLFVLEHITPSAVKMFGKKKEHLKIDFTNAKGKTISAIGFFSKPDDFDVEIAAGTPLTLLANLEKSYFLGKEELRLRIVDIV